MIISDGAQAKINLSGGPQHGKQVILKNKVILVNASEKEVLLSSITPSVIP